MPIGAPEQSVRNSTVSMAAHGGCTNRLEHDEVRTVRSTALESPPISFRDEVHSHAKTQAPRWRPRFCSHNHGQRGRMHTAKTDPACALARPAAWEHNPTKVRKPNCRCHARRDRTRFVAAQRPKGAADGVLKYRLLPLLSVVGPGFITANVDNDPGGILTYSQAGAKYGYALLWTLVPTTIALIVVQEMASRMAAATGKGLSDLIREEFGLRPISATYSRSSWEPRRAWVFSA
jgi:hypothetical protein